MGVIRRILSNRRLEAQGYSHRLRDVLHKNHPIGLWFLHIKENAPWPPNKEINIGRNAIKFTAFLGRSVWFLGQQKEGR